MKSIVIDTDAGTDADDFFALVYAIKSGADIKAITTVHGNTEVRGKIVRKLERLLNVDIPIIAGQECSEKMIKKYWTGIEEKALTEDERREEIEIGRFPEYTSDMGLVCLGPLTNIAYQLQENRSIINVKRVYVMGTSKKSHNFKVDLQAYRKVFSQPWRKFLITKQVCRKIAFTRKELEEIRGNQLGEFLYDSTIRWLDYSRKEKALMYDVLVVSAALDEGYVRFKKQDNTMLSYDINPELREKLLKVVRK